MKIEFDYKNYLGHIEENGTDKEFTIVASQWAPGLWAGLEGCDIQIFWDTNRKYIRKVLAIDYQTRTIKTNGQGISLPLCGIYFR